MKGLLRSDDKTDVWAGGCPSWADSLRGVLFVMGVDEPGECVHCGVASVASQFPEWTLGLDFQKRKQPASENKGGHHAEIIS